MATVDISAYAKRFRGRLGEFKRKVCTNLFDGVVRDTPVDTGRLQSSWIFSKEPLAVDGDPRMPGPFNDPTFAINMQVASQVTDKDETYYLTNPMPYANVIEYDGHSSIKAPDGMVRKNIVRVAEEIRSEGEKISGGGESSSSGMEDVIETTETMGEGAAEGVVGAAEAVGATIVEGAALL